VSSSNGTKAADAQQPVHVVALSGLKTKKEKVRYACEHAAANPSTAEVLAWLQRYGVVSDPRRERSHVSSIVSAWRRENGLSDTGDVPTMSPGVLAELDKLTDSTANEHANSESEQANADVVMSANTLTVPTNATNAGHEQANNEHEHANAAAHTVNSEDEQVNAVGEPSRLLAVLARWSWVAVLVMALGISWWSLFALARLFGVPSVLAAGVSVVFDAAALVCARLAHGYALSPDSGAGPRVMMLALVTASVYLNWNHADVAGYGMVAAVMFAAPAVVAVLLFELESGWRSRAARRARGRVAEPLPVIGRWGWIFHPWQSLVTVWRVSHARGTAVRDRELARANARGDN